MNDQQIEAESQAKGLNAPRVTRSQIEDAIESIDFVTHTSASGQVLRWAVLNMANGYAVVGRPSVAVSPENDDAELGKRIATDNSISEAWPLLGYELKSKLAAEPKDFRERAQREHARLGKDVDKLASFVQSPAYADLDIHEQNRLTDQLRAMRAYFDILSARVDAFLPTPA